jgi:serine/threonine protein kinase
LQRPVVVKALRNDIAPFEPAAVDGIIALAGAVRHARHVLQAERRVLVRLRNAGCHSVPAPIDYVYDRNPVLAEVGGLDPFLSASEPYLVLPYLTGRTLEEVLAREYSSGMDWRQALRLILPVVRAIEVLHRPWRHQSGRTWHCVYQDLKPANLMVAPHGPLLLIDFGGCQVVVDGVPVLEGSCTPGYAPPECDEGPARVLLACADVFTIGSTLHHMLTGTDPRDRLDRRGARPGDPFELNSLPPHAPPGLRRLLARCLAPRPSDRPADAGRVAAAIEELLAG